MSSIGGGIAPPQAAVLRAVSPDAEMHIIGTAGAVTIAFVTTASVVVRLFNHEPHEKYEQTFFTAEAQRTQRFRVH
jgi:hypothetical protein